MLKPREVVSKKGMVNSGHRVKPFEKLDLAILQTLVTLWNLCLGLGWDRGQIAVDQGVKGEGLSRQLFQELRLHSEEKVIRSGRMGQDSGLRKDFCLFSGERGFRMFAG